MHKINRKALLSMLGTILIALGLFIPTIAHTFEHVSIYHHFNLQTRGLLVLLGAMLALVVFNIYSYHLAYAMIMSAAIHLMYTTAYGESSFWAELFKGAALTSKFLVFFNPIITVTGKGVSYVSDFLAERLAWRGYGWEIVYAGLVCILSAGVLHSLELVAHLRLKIYRRNLLLATLLGFILGWWLVSFWFAWSIIGVYALTLCLGLLRWPNLLKIFVVVIAYLWLFYPYSQRFH